MIITNIVIDGGGSKGIAFCGAIKALEEKNILKNIKNIIGSSAGAIIALLLSMKLSADEIEDIMNGINFDELKDKRFGAMMKLYFFVKKYGKYKGDNFLKIIENILEKYTNNKNITFRQLFIKYKINLVITGSNISRGIIEYFNHIYSPNMPVKIALRISMSLPYVFEAVRYNDCLYVDGGILNNYPFWYFGDTKHTIGLKLMKPIEKKNDIINDNYIEINNIKKFSIYLMKAMAYQIERLDVRDDYWKRTIGINTYDIQTTDFDISEENKNLLIKEGYESVIKYFDK